MHARVHCNQQSFLITVILSIIITTVIAIYLLGLCVLYVFTRLVYGPDYIYFTCDFLIQYKLPVIQFSANYIFNFWTQFWLFYVSVNLEIAPVAQLSLWRPEARH